MLLLRSCPPRAAFARCARVAAVGSTPPRLHFLTQRTFSRTSQLRQNTGGFKIPPWATLGNVKKYWPQLVAGAGGLVVIYGLSNVVFWVAGTFLKLDFEDVFWFGFGTGIFSAAILAGGGAYLYRRNMISTPYLHRWALAKLSKDARVQSVLGHNLASGSLKAFSFEPGHFSLTKRLAWVAPRAQVLFQVSGEKGEGFATAEAVQQPNGLVFNLLALDVIPPASSGKQPTLLVVHGREEKLHVRGSLRGFLQSDRAAYIPQDRSAPSDEELVREQAELPSEDPEIASSGRA